MAPDQLANKSKPASKMPQSPEQSTTTSEPLAPANITSPTPANWPPDVTFLAAPIYSPSLTPAQLTFLRTRPTDAEFASGEVVDLTIPSPSPPVRLEIQSIVDPAHPAHGQRGLFVAPPLLPDSTIADGFGRAGRQPLLRPGELVAVYVGVVRDGRVEATERQSDYELWLSRDAGIAVDAATAGNEARFVNDYRGVPRSEDTRVTAGRRQHQQQQHQKGNPAERTTTALAAILPTTSGRGPNAEFRDVWWRPPGPGPDGRRRKAAERGIGIFVRREGKRRAGGTGVGAGRSQPVKGAAKAAASPSFSGIAAGEEILVSYGKGFWNARKAGEKDGLSDGGGA